MKVNSPLTVVYREIPRDGIKGPTSDAYKTAMRPPKVQTPESPWPSSARKNSNKTFAVLHAFPMISADPLGPQA